eukprot:10461630-Alexandrium_andersonii.AAC.1
MFQCRRAALGQGCAVVRRRLRSHRQTSSPLCTAASRRVAKIAVRALGPAPAGSLMVIGCSVGRPRLRR